MPAHEPLAVGVYDDLEKAERTMDALRRAGFPAEEIGIIGNVDNQKQSAVPTPANLKVPEANARNGLVGGAVFLMRPFRIRQSRMKIGKCGPHFCRFERK